MLITVVQVTCSSFSKGNYSCSRINRSWWTKCATKSRSHTTARRRPHALWHSRDPHKQRASCMHWAQTLRPALTLMHL